MAEQEITVHTLVSWLAEQKGNVKSDHAGIVYGQILGYTRLSKSDHAGSV